MKIYTMTRDYPETEGQPVKLHVPECDIEALKARGWKINEEKKATENTVLETDKETPSIEVEDAKEEVSYRGRKRNH